jgi:translation elongation factor EF-Tu-like GTPase
MYEENLNVNFDDEYEQRVESEMMAALNEVDRIGSDLGVITSSRMQEVDASRLSRWLIGEEKDLLPPRRE